MTKCSAQPPTGMKPSAEASRTWGRPWNAVETGPKRDLLGDLASAVRKKGMKFGFYYSLYEWFNPLWKSDRKRYVAEHPGTFFYHRPSYRDQTWIPATLEYGVLVDGERWWVDRFRNV